MPTSDVSLAPPVLPDSAPIKPAPPKAFPKPRVVSAARANSVEFDPLVVAKLGPGWSTQLRAVLAAWVDAAATEVTGQSGASRASSSVAPSEAQPTPDVAPVPLPETPEHEEPKAETETSVDVEATGEAETAAPEDAVERSLQ